jgi:hypothetical protein
MIDSIIELLNKKVATYQEWAKNNGAKSFERIKTNNHLILVLYFNKLFVVIMS